MRFQTVASSFPLFLLLVLELAKWASALPLGSIDGEGSFAGQLVARAPQTGGDDPKPVSSGRPKRSIRSASSRSSVDLHEVPQHKVDLGEEYKQLSNLKGLEAGNSKADDHSRVLAPVISPRVVAKPSAPVSPGEQKTSRPDTPRSRPGTPAGPRKQKSNASLGKAGTPAGSRMQESNASQGQSLPGTPQTVAATRRPPPRPTGPRAGPAKPSTGNYRADRSARPGPDMPESLPIQAAGSRQAPPSDSRPVPRPDTAAAAQPMPGPSKSASSNQDDAHTNVPPTSSGVDWSGRVPMPVDRDIQKGTQVWVPDAGGGSKNGGK
jgi:hypothetical protein